MRKVAALALALMASAALAGAQKVMMPAQTSNPNVRIVPATDDFSKARRISRDEAIKLVKEGKAVFVDVRSKESYDYAHIKGALGIPESQLMNRLKEIPPRRMIITYCAWQNEHTSARAVLDLNAHGVKNTACLLGGWNEWQALGLPTESSMKPAAK